MQADDISGQCHWYAIHTKPKQESRADQSLRLAKIETFAPRIFERSPLKIGTQTGYRFAALFPGYIFARFVAEQHSWSIRRTSGVQNLVSFGNIPVPVEDHVIALLRAKVEGMETQGSEPLLVAGEHVTIQDGPLRNLAGIFEREMGGSERVVVLLSAIHWRAVVDLRSVAKISTCS